MLTQVFNEQVDYQAEMQATLREKTGKHDLEAHNHTLKGHAFLIPKNAAIGVADGGKLSYKKDEEFKRIFDHILHMQELMANINEGFERMNDILDKIEEETNQLDKITELFNEGDMDAARDYITSITSEDASGMTDEQAQEWLIHKGYEHIQNIDDLTEAYKKELKDQHNRIEKLPEGSPERIAAQQKLTHIEDRYRKVAEVKKLPFEQAVEKVLRSGEGVEQSKETRASLVKARDQVDDKFSANSEDELISDDDLWSDLELSDDFNVAATGDNLENSSSEYNKEGVSTGATPNSFTPS